MSGRSPHDIVTNLPDVRAHSARYYDLAPHYPADVPFYLARMPGPTARVLELGCGTGRVAMPLASACAELVGIDHSAAMVEICRRNVAAAGLTDRVAAHVGDITRLKLDRVFDFIIAPFRVFQNLASDAEVAGLFEVLRAHLAPPGRCILNAFQPLRSATELRAAWQSTDVTLEWTRPIEGGRVEHWLRKARHQADPLVLYPDLIYRRYAGDEMAEETILRVPLRCWYPDELLAEIASEGFEVTNRWGGYAGETYGSGPELVVEFTGA